MVSILEITTSKQRRCLPPHIKVILNYMVDNKFENVRIKYNKHCKIYWTCNGRTCFVSCSITPKNRDFVVGNIMDDVKRQIREANQ